MPVADVWDMDLDDLVGWIRFAEYEDRPAWVTDDLAQKLYDYQKIR